MGKPKSTKLQRMADQAEVSFIRVGDMAVDEALIKQSPYFQRLEKLGIPNELSLVHGEHDVRTALAVRGVAVSTALAIDARAAEVRIECYKDFLRLQGENDAAIAAAVLAAQQQGALPIVPVAPTPPPSPGVTYTIAQSARPGGTAPTVAARLSISIDADGKAQIAHPVEAAITDPKLVDAVGLCTTVNGSECRVAYAGLTVPGYTNLIAGQRYWIGSDGLPCLFDHLFDQYAAGGRWWCRQIGRALTSTTMLVVEGVPQLVTL